MNGSSNTVKSECTSQPLQCLVQAKWRVPCTQSIVLWILREDQNTSDWHPYSDLNTYLQKYWDFIITDQSSEFRSL